MGTHKSYTFAIDFDGTIVEHAFPEIGRLKSDAIRVMRRLQAAGHKIILWTCRTNDPGERDYLNEAVGFLWINSFRADSVNENIDPKLPYGDPKVFADYYLDDAAFPPFMGWLDFEVCMEEMGIL